MSGHKEKLAAYLEKFLERAAALQERLDAHRQALAVLESGLGESGLEDDSPDQALADEGAAGEPGAQEQAAPLDVPPGGLDALIDQELSALAGVSDAKAWLAAAGAALGRLESVGEDATLADRIAEQRTRLRDGIEFARGIPGHERELASLSRGAKKALAAGRHDELEALAEEIEAAFGSTRETYVALVTLATPDGSSGATPQFQGLLGQLGATLAELQRLNGAVGGAPVEGDIPPIPGQEGSDPASQALQALAQAREALGAVSDLDAWESGAADLVKQGQEWLGSNPDDPRLADAAAHVEAALGAGQQIPAIREARRELADLVAAGEALAQAPDREQASGLLSALGELNMRLGDRRDALAGFAGLEQALDDTRQAIADAIAPLQGLLDAPLAPQGAPEPQQPAGGGPAEPDGARAALEDERVGLEMARERLSQRESPERWRRDAEQIIHRAEMWLDEAKAQQLSAREQASVARLRDVIRQAEPAVVALGDHAAAAAALPDEPGSLGELAEFQGHLLTQGPALTGLAGAPVAGLAAWLKEQQETTTARQTKIRAAQREAERRKDDIERLEREFARVRDALAALPGTTSPRSWQDAAAAAQSEAGAWTERHAALGEPLPAQRGELAAALPALHGGMACAAALEEIAADLPRLQAKLARAEQAAKLLSHGDEVDSLIERIDAQRAALAALHPPLAAGLARALEAQRETAAELAAHLRDRARDLEAEAAERSKHEELDAAHAEALAALADLALVRDPDRWQPAGDHALGLLDAWLGRHAEHGQIQAHREPELLAAQAALRRAHGVAGDLRGLSAAQATFAPRLAGAQDPAQAQSLLGDLADHLARLEAHRRDLAAQEAEALGGLIGWIEDQRAALGPLQAAAQARQAEIVRRQREETLLAQLQAQEPAIHAALGALPGLRDAERWRGGARHARGLLEAWLHLSEGLAEPDAARIASLDRWKDLLARGEDLSAGLDGAREELAAVQAAHARLGGHPDGAQLTAVAVDAASLEKRLTELHDAMEALDNQAGQPAIVAGLLAALGDVRAECADLAAQLRALESQISGQHAGAAQRAPQEDPQGEQQEQEDPHHSLRGGREMSEDQRVQYENYIDRRVVEELSHVYRMRREMAVVRDLKAELKKPFPARTLLRTKEIEIAPNTLQRIKQDAIRFLEQGR